MTIALGQSGTYPAGNTTPDLHGFSFFTVGPYWRELGRSIAADNVSPYSASIIANFGAGLLQASWFGSTVNGKNSLYGTPFNVVPGTQPLLPVTINLYASQSDAGNVPLYPSMSTESWPGDGTGNLWITTFPTTATIASGSPNVLGVGGTLFTSRVLAGDVIIFNNELTRYTVQSVTNDTHLVLTTNYSGSATSGTMIAGPFNRPARAAELGNTDYHAYVILRDEGTGGAHKLYETYTVSSEDSGATWTVAQVSIWDIETGAQRPDGWTSTAAGGTPNMPLMVHYDECLAGLIAHPLRGLIPNVYCMLNACIWPATHGVGAGFPGVGLPMGARLRLTNAWYQANVGTFPAIIQPIVTAMRTYGVMITDIGGGSLQIDGVNDDRWVPSDLDTLRAIPLSSFEVIDTIAPQVTFDGPLVGTAGVAQSFSVGYNIAANTNFTADFYLQYSTDGGNTFFNGAGPQTVSNGAPGPFTMSWTPSAAATYLLQIHYSGTYWINAPQITFTAIAATVTRTTTANGNWASSSTWLGGVVPGIGAKAIINHNVTITADTTIGDDTAANVLDVTNGTLTVTGAVLTICGGSTWGKNTGGTTVDRLTVQNSGATPAGIILDAKATAAPVMSVDNDTRLVFTGTSSARCFLKTRDQTAGLPGYITLISSPRCFYFSAAYTDFANLGTSTIQGLYSFYTNTSLNLTNPPFTMDHCTVNRCGMFPDLGILDGGVNFRLTESTWTNPVDANGFHLQVGVSGPISGGGTRLIDKCRFLGGAPNLRVPQGITITASYFHDLIYGGKTQAEWTVLDGSLIRHPAGGEIQMAGNVSNLFFLGNPTNPAQATNGLFMSAFADSSVTNSIFQTTAAANNGICISQTEGGVSDRITTISGNIILPNGVGDSTGVVAFMATNITDPNHPFAVVEHNTVFVGSADGAIAGTSAIPEMTGFINSFRSNLFWSNAVHAGSNAIGSFYPTPANYPDPVSGAHADYNGWYNLATVPGGTWTAPNDKANGTVYNLPLSTTPGVHDVANVNPLFIDSTRNLQTWAIHKGYARAADGSDLQVLYALLAIQADPTLIKTDLLPWIRAGFVPGSTSFRATSYPGDTSTTDASGNAWTNGAPGIGAMAVSGSVVGGTGILGATERHDALVAVGSAVAGATSATERRDVLAMLATIVVTGGTALAGPPAHHLTNSPKQQVSDGSYELTASPAQAVAQGWT